MYYYITILSNFLFGYEKYSQRYSKENLISSTYPDKFYILKENELDIGLKKANNLLVKTKIENDKTIRIKTNLSDIKVFKNKKNGKGWYIEQNWIPIVEVDILEENKWINYKIEDVMAMSYSLKNNNFLSYSELIPRTLSLLPIALACQANCKFCFSESSISFDQKSAFQNFDLLESLCLLAKQRGATRFVITGGGEPTILKFENLLKIVQVAKKYFSKIVLISNGIFLSKLPEEEMIEKTKMLIESGLTTLAISYHHYDATINNMIMGASINNKYLFETLKKHKINKILTLRLICVLQKNGIDNKDKIEKYISYAKDNGIGQVCFKELYVSSGIESLYSEQEANKYSVKNQIPLSLLVEYLDEKAELIHKLPWGSPVYRYLGVEVAAYTEPSVGWERTNGIARSWNILSDGKCYVSLEDKESLLKVD